MKVPIVHLGCIGHFILGDKCLYRRHTQVGDNYRVSTVGDLYVTGDKREVIGGLGKHYYETMVFETHPYQVDSNIGCGCHEVKDIGNPIWTQRYQTIAEAHKGHEDMIRWAVHQLTAGGLLR